MRDAAVTYSIVSLCVVLMVSGLAGAWVASNVAKRLAAQTLLIFSVLMIGAVLSAPQALLVGGAAIAFAYLAVGASILVRLQEAYGSIEAPEIDAADAQAEAEEIAP